MAVALHSLWHSPRHTQLMSLYHNALIIFFILSIALAASSKPQLNLHLDLQLPTPLPTLEQPQLCPTMDTARSARESTHTGGDDSSSNVDENGSVISKRPRKPFHGVCPLCWVLGNAGNQPHSQLSCSCHRKHADPDTSTLFESQDVNSSFDYFRICKPCSSIVLQASKFLCATSSSSKEYLPVRSIMQMKTKQPIKILLTAFASQGQVLWRRLFSQRWP